MPDGPKMIIGKKGVTYGLQAPSGKKQQSQAKPSIFGSFEGEDALDVDRNAAVRAQQGVKRSDAKVKQMQAAALMEDANCFDYDSFYDGIQEQRKQEKVTAYQNEKSGPKYLASMMAARDQRQRMRDIIYEKQEAAAAKADAELFGEKEQFATAAYKKKLQEDKLFAEQMERKDKADEGKTVEAQGMDGFLGILQSTLAKKPDAEQHEGQGAAQDAQAEPSDGREATGNVPSFESMLEKKARLKLEEKMSTMDKYERKRFEMERAAASRSRGRTGTDGGAAGVSREGAGGAHGPGASEPRRDAEGAAAGTNGDTPAPDASNSAWPERKRASEDKIAGARERAKQRRQK